jgi:hypothetical protein
MSPQAGFLLQDQVLPRLQSAIPSAVSCIGSEDAEEIIQDGVALAAKMMHNAELGGKKLVQSASKVKQGKQVTAGNIAYYCIVKLRNGCRSSGMVTGDVYGSGAQIQGRTRLTSLDEVAARDEEGGEIFEFHDVLADEGEDPATKATRKMDWETFMSGLSERERVAILFMLEGKTLRHAAHVLRVSDSAMQESKRDLRVKILSFMGVDILATIQRRPGWKDNIEAVRERMAVRYDRCHQD